MEQRSERAFREVRPAPRASGPTRTKLRLIPQPPAVARQNLQVARETLEMARERMQAGVINTVEVVQAQQTVSSAQLDVTNSIFAHNLAKLTLARAMGHARQICSDRKGNEIRLESEDADCELRNWLNTVSLVHSDLAD